jgi:multisubunit Na+/H+ antiporter MnhE subunit
MKHKKRLIRELYWFFGGILCGIVIFMFFYRLLSVSFDLGVLAAGAIVTLLAMYVVRLTMWVFKKNM